MSASLLLLVTFFPWYVDLVHHSLSAIRQLAFHIHEQDALHRFMLLNLLVVLKVMLSLVPVFLVAVLPGRLTVSGMFVIRQLALQKETHREEADKCSPSGSNTGTFGDIVATVGYGKLITSPESSPSACCNSPGSCNGANDNFTVPAVLNSTGQLLFFDNDQ